MGRWPLLLKASADTVQNLSSEARETHDKIPASQWLWNGHYNLVRVELVIGPSSSWWSGFQKRWTNDVADNNLPGSTSKKGISIKRSASRRETMGRHGKNLAFGLCLEPPAKLRNSLSHFWQLLRRFVTKTLSLQGVQYTTTTTPSNHRIVYDGWHHQVSSFAREDFAEKELLPFAFRWMRWCLVKNLFSQLFLVLQILVSFSSFSDRLADVWMVCCPSQTSVRWIAVECDGEQWKKMIDSTPPFGFW